MSTRSTIVASDEASEGRTGVRYHLSRDHHDEPETLRVELHGVLEVELHATAGRPPVVELLLPAAAWWDLVRRAAESRARDHHVTPPLYAIRYDEPPDEAGHVRVERIDDGTDRHRDSEWEALATAAAALPTDESVASPHDADTARRLRAVSTVAGHYARLQSLVIDALQPALARGADPLHVLLAQAGVPGVEIVHTAQALRVVAGDDERRAWAWLLEAAPAALGGAAPHQALRQGRVAEVQDLIWRAVSGGFA